MFFYFFFNKGTIKPIFFMLPRFELAQLFTGTVILIIGKRSTGKSTLLNDLLYHYYNPSYWYSRADCSATLNTTIWIVLLCATRFAPRLPPEIWRNIIFPNLEIQTAPDHALGLTSARHYNVFKPYMPENIITEPSSERLEQFIQDRKNEKGDSVLRPSLLAGDDFSGHDFSGHKRFVHSSASLKAACIQSHRLNMTCILVLKYIMQTRPVLRDNADFVFISGHFNTIEQNKIWEWWFSAIEKDVFREVLKTFTDNYSFLVVNVRKAAHAHDWRNCFFYYKVKTPIKNPYGVLY